MSWQHLIRAEKCCVSYGESETFIFASRAEKKPSPSLKAKAKAIRRSASLKNDGLHFRQPWVMGVQQEIERLKQWFHEQEKLLRECEALKAQVKMLLQRVSELERVR
ncbi:hypothetical protein YC2023_049736 [Brassica napus]